MTVHCDVQRHVLKSDCLQNRDATKVKTSPEFRRCFAPRELDRAHQTKPHPQHAHDGSSRSKHIIFQQETTPILAVQPSLHPFIKTCVRACTSGTGTDGSKNVYTLAYSLGSRHGMNPLPLVRPMQFDEQVAVGCVHGQDTPRVNNSGRISLHHLTSNILCSARRRFQKTYLVVYTCAVLGDWLQGPYVYALYSMYNFSKLQIGQLFIAGFGSSMVFGIAIGSMTDRYGRKASCLAYCLTYILSCMTKHYSSFLLLMVGRILGGISYSILFTSFDSWLIAEHNRRGFPSEWLNQTYALQPSPPFPSRAHPCRDPKCSPTIPPLPFSGARLPKP